MTERKTDGDLTGYPSIDKPWLNYYKQYPNYDTPSPDCGIYEFLKKCNSRHMQGTALNYFGRKISYRKMLEEIDYIAELLREIDVNKGEIISVCGLNTPEFFEIIYAINKAGAVSNLIGLTSPIADLHEQIITAQSRVVFVIDIALDTILEAAKNSKVETIIYVPIEQSMPFAIKCAMKSKKKLSGKHSPRREQVSGITICEWGKWANKREIRKREMPMIDPSDLALIVYTGGSTGVPKGVMLSNKNMNSYYVNFLKANMEGLNQYCRGDRFLAYVPIFLAFGVNACGHAPLCFSMELILAPDPDPFSVIKVLLKEKPNHVIGGKPLIDGWTAQADKYKTNYSFVHSVMYGGEGADESWEKKSEDVLIKHHMSVPIYNGYGMTETAGAIMFACKNAKTRLLTFPDVNVRIVDPEDCYTELGYETEGELCFSSDIVMMGYFRNDSETMKVIFEQDGQRWIKTNDLAKMSADGTIIITGRIKRIYYKLAQNNMLVRVYPMRTEEEIKTLPEIKKCAVLGVRDSKTSYKTVCYLVAEMGYKFDEIRESVDRICKEHLPESHIPDEYIFVDEFPLTRAGKVDYKALEKQYEEA